MCLCSHVLAVSGFCVEDQQSLLLQLKNNEFQFNASKSTKLKRWNQSIPHCDWNGVTCDKEGHVIGLDLNNEFIDGELHNSKLGLFEFVGQWFERSNTNGNFPVEKSAQGKDWSNALLAIPSLEEVSMRSCNLSGPIDSSLGRLSTSQDFILMRLYLSYNNLSADANIMDANLSSFPNLEILGLSSCNLREFPLFLRNQSNIGYLDLSNNQFIGLIPYWIWEILGEDGDLDLSNNSLTGFERHMLNYTVNLDVVDLHSNKLNGNIPPFINSFFLDLSRNHINTVIPHNIGAQFHSVYFLELSRNKFHGDIPHSLCNIPTMKKLDLSNNMLEGTIPPCLIHSETLSILILGKNKLKGNIPNAFPKSCDFSILDVKENQLSGFIPKSMISCTNLRVLNIGNNHISGHFPCFLRNIFSLEVLVLRKNQFQGPIGCLENDGSWCIHIIDLAFNNFSGFLPAKVFTTWESMMVDIPLVSISNYIALNYFVGTPHYYSMTIVSKGQEMEWDEIQQSFTLIDFSSNNFEGPTPKELMNLEALYVLNLSNNAFSGKIPSSIGNMKQLESLDLSNNSLTGEIPTELAKAHKFNQFDASSFQGNKGLYGPPLTKIPNNGKPGLMLPPIASQYDHGIDFTFITGMEFGVIFGLAIIIGPLFFWRKWKIMYWKYVDDVLYIIFPQLYLDYQRHAGQWHAVLRWSR
ncbi:receptor-like protein 19 [Prosopis cineraria]|uniref:receptor-like protein 19 n=1 Tax=Prosopis cineraria TaxID=364024 RepID=UPI00240EDBAF|nr:receptor-like protein 19 [Prosopis cineraria]